MLGLIGSVFAVCTIASLAMATGLIGTETAVGIGFGSVAFGMWLKLGLKV